MTASWGFHQTRVSLPLYPSLVWGLNKNFLKGKKKNELLEPTPSNEKQKTCGFQQASSLGPYFRLAALY